MGLGMLCVFKHASCSHIHRGQSDGNTSTRYGQDFSHMCVQPTIIDVQLEEAEGPKSLEVCDCRATH